MANKTETRSQAVSFRSDSDSFELHGLVCPYNTPADIGGQFEEVVAPGAFTRALREKQDVRILLNHNADVVLARTASGTATLFDSPEGLRCVIRLDRNQSKHHEIYSAVKRGDINQMSYAFKARPNGERWGTRKGKQRRTLTDVDLFDASVVTYAANQGTSVSARHAVSDDAALDAYHRRRVKELEHEILCNDPGYHITCDLRVLPMTAAEVEARVDAENRRGVERIGREIARDRARLEIEAARKEMEE